MLAAFARFNTSLENTFGCADIRVQDAASTVGLVCCALALTHGTQKVAASRRSPQKFTPTVTHVLLVRATCPA